MAVAPITPQMPDIRGEPITVAVTYTSTNNVTETITLPTYMPKIDLSRAHPVLNLMILYTEDDVGVEKPSNSLVFPSAKEMKRGTSPDSANEWQISSASTIEVYDAAIDYDGIAFICYIPAGVQNA